MRLPLPVTHSCGIDSPTIGAILADPIQVVGMTAGVFFESTLERAVSRHIGDMPFLWPEVPDLADRKLTESNSIGLLSCRRGGVDVESPKWLGLIADSEKARTSAPWNVIGVDDDYNPNFLGILDRLVHGVGKIARY